MINPQLLMIGVSRRSITCTERVRRYNENINRHMAALGWTQHLTPQLWIRLTRTEKVCTQGSPSWQLEGFLLAETHHNFDPRAVARGDLMGF